MSKLRAPRLRGGAQLEAELRLPPALTILPQLRAQLNPSVRLICEGGIASPEQAHAALDAGADSVVVGTAITGIDLQVAAYCSGLLA